jgi:hypothetical protein
MKRVVCVIAMLAICQPAFADGQKQKRRIWDKKFWVRDKKFLGWDKKFWIATVVQAGSIVADIETTKAGLRRGATELNPIFGRHPGRPRLYGTSILIFGAELWAQHYLKNDAEEHPSDRYVWWLCAYGNAGLHTAAAIHNARLPGRHPTGSEQLAVQRDFISRSAPIRADSSAGRDLSELASAQRIWLRSGPREREQSFALYKWRPR